MYKIDEIQLYVEVEGYIPFYQQANFNEIELLPNKSGEFNTVLQQGITSRGRIKFLAYVFGYDDYIELQNTFIQGKSFTFIDRFGTWDNMAILELGEPVRQNDEVIGFDIELVKVSANV